MHSVSAVMGCLTTLLDALDTMPFSGFRSTIFFTWHPGWLHL